MSDCFDHALDACESAMDCFYGDRPDNSGYYNHRSNKTHYEDYPIIKVIASTDKAYLFSIDEAHLPFIGDEFDVRENFIIVWVPKSAVRSDESIITGDECIHVKIHKETLKGSLRYCIPKQKELINYKPTTKKEGKDYSQDGLLTSEDRKLIIEGIGKIRTNDHVVHRLCEVIYKYEKTLCSKGV